MNCISDPIYEDAKSIEELITQARQINEALNRGSLVRVLLPSGKWKFAHSARAIRGGVQVLRESSTGRLRWDYIKAFIIEDRNCKENAEEK